MSKSDEIRRMRELQYEQRERAAAGTANSPAPSQVPAVSAAPDAPDHPTEMRTSKARGAADEQGKCSVCGKVRGLVNGLVTVHQKGLGKLCPGSRKEPA